MVVEYVDAAPLSEALEVGDDLGQLGRVVAATAAAIGRIGFGRPGFFGSALLDVGEELSWSGQLAEFAESCMQLVPADRLSDSERRAWADLCGARASVLRAVDGCASLVHADFNPKNLLVAHAPRAGTSTRCWTGSSASPGVRTATRRTCFASRTTIRTRSWTVSGTAYSRAAARPDWEEIGRALDLFALSELLTRPAGHVVADRVATEVRRRLA